ncbi:choice-of-anchor L domain-containing protein [Phaeodactylibacter luteus]|uniref:T9SS type B sorting domain-containing protein n=1 Tax=Phaeodactylibacter luteus TaxID=1564516 RepID=A0A5C6RK14_9BACT|nr:choice-of-anchor L domain-containing protein [Phaeodactylibacter luteus]TXB62701.1 T9SS type B sorting domain-containing protein [Phaeodactylibacter luteus]
MMKKYAFLAFFVLPFALLAQPVNDDCAGVIDLGVAPACPDTTFFTNVGATPSDIGFGNIPDCFNGGIVGNDVWFAFTTSDTIFDYTITVTGLADGMGAAGMTNPQVAIYRGLCAFDNLAELDCESAEEGSDFVELDIMGLTPNVTYYLRISDYSATATPNWGTFQVCVDEMEPASNIDEGGSTACTGILFDSGGPDGDYGNNENFEFNICPDQPNECIIFTLDYYNIEQGGFIPTDVLTFYDGPSADQGVFIADIGGSDFVTDEGGGAVCYEVRASSGCLTVVFTSDAQTSFEGFQGSWQCSQECDPYTPVVINDNATEEDIVEFVSTPSVTATITDINCPDVSYGTFEAGDNTDLGLERGLLLTTGTTSWAIGPNNDGGGGNFNSNNQAPGDDDLDYLSGVFGDATLSENACVVELDVFVTTDELSFEYVFGSEEYPEFVGDGFNDIFAFLVSGPGIVGDPNMNNQQNIAVLPNGIQTPVQINSVNNLENWEFYRNNTDGLSLQYDGLTSDFLGVKKSLTASTPVQPCNTYHLKLAIADRGDSSYDSGVFVSELKGGTPNLGVQFSSGIDYLVENCTDQEDFVVISLNQPVEDSTTFKVTISGTADNGEDYILDIPDEVLFEPGQSEISFPLTTLTDMEMEETETLIIVLSNDFGCGEVVYTTLVVEIRDEISVNIDIPQDTALVCADSSLVLSVNGASSYFWSPVSVFDEPTGASPSASPQMSQWVYVEGIVGPCVANDSIFLQLVDPNIAATPVDTVFICQGDQVQLSSTNNVGDQNLQWAPAIGLNDPNAPNPIATPEVSTDYIVSVDVAGCVVQDTVNIDVSPFDFPDVAADTIICQNYSVQLASFIDPQLTTTTFEWTPATGLDDASIAHATATPDVTTTYQLFAESGNGACSQIGEVTVTVVPADIDIVAPARDSVEICLGDVVNLQADILNGAATDITWSPNNGTLSDTTGLTVSASPEVSGWYFGSFNAGDCQVFDSIYIRVDSIPDSEIIADPAKDKYCAGEIVTLRSNTYEPSFFPDLSAEWQAGPGQETPDSLWNLVLTVIDTFEYVRITTNRGCTDTASILLLVQEPPVASITPADTLVCVGQAVSFQLEITGEYESFEWTGSNLSCNDCFAPTASPASGRYEVLIEQEGCDFNAIANVNVIPDPVLQLNTISIICLGESVELNTASDGNSTYTWTASDPAYTSTDPQPVVTPAETTTYYVIADNGSCTPVQDSITINVIGEVMLDLFPDEFDLCFGESTNLNVEVFGGSPEDEFFWSGSDGTTYEGAPVTVSPTDTTTYTLTYVSGGGCTTITDSLQIAVEPVFQLDGIDISQDSIGATFFEGDEVVLTAIYESDFNPEELTFTWMAVTADSNLVIGSGLGLEQISYQLLEAGTQTFMLQVTTPEGCVYIVQLEIDVDEINVNVPNAFTPNGDMQNDFFNFLAEANADQIQVLEFKVYNRWGQLVYDNDTPETGWDGQFNDKPQPSEVYYYRIRVARPNGFELDPFQGDVTLAR